MRRCRATVARRRPVGREPVGRGPYSGIRGQGSENCKKTPVTQNTQKSSQTRLPKGKPPPMRFFGSAGASRRNTVKAKGVAPPEHSAIKGWANPPGEPLFIPRDFRKGYTPRLKNGSTQQNSKKTGFYAAQNLSKKTQLRIDTYAGYVYPAGSIRLDIGKIVALKQLFY